MKFGKSLNMQIVDTFPDWRDKFLSYKDLKKRLKLIAAAGERPGKRQRVDGGGAGGSPPPMTPEEAGFVCLLEAELDKFNAFFLEKEEEYIIRQKELQEWVVRAVAMGSTEQRMLLAKEIVDFHGEMVLLQNYSMLNYTGLVKILKKHDKRTGALIRLPFVQRVLQQPFISTGLLHKLVKECEVMLDQLIPASRPSEPSEDRKDDSDSDEKPSKPASSLANGSQVLELDVDEIDDIKCTYMKSTMAALRSLKEIRSGSSTVSMFSMPPLHGSNGEEEQER